MTTSGGEPLNSASGNATVGVQGQIVTITGDVQLTVGRDALPAEKYKVGAENLRSRNPGAARTLIWQAMIGGCMSSTVLFHWLVAMLSGRAVRQFSREEIDQLRHFRSQYAEAGNDAWADGVRLIYRLLDTALAAAGTPPPGAVGDAADMPLLVRQFENLEAEQRELVRPHLELFLTGALKDKMWRDELKRAQDRQHAGNRLGRAWMFFQPTPAKVVLPAPEPARVTRTDDLKMRAGTLLSAAAAGYLGWELLWHGMLLGVLGFVAALAAGVVAARADLDWRFLTERRRRKDDQFRVLDPPSSSPSGDQVADRVDTLFRRYFRRYAPDKAERERWEAAVAGFRKFHQDEIIGVCRAGRFSVADEVAWLIRYQVRQMKKRWQDNELHGYRHNLLPRPGTLAVRRIGLAALTLGGAWAVISLHTYLMADALSTVVAIPSAIGAWRCWLRVSLEHRRFAADSEEHARRQADIDEEYERWSRRLDHRPKDAEISDWLECDRTVLLGRVLDQFHLPRSRLHAHAFLEEPGVGVKRARIENGQLRYGGYRILMFLLAEDGVRQVWASLDFMTGTLAVRERTSYRYDAIVSVRVAKEARHGQKFELTLTAGNPITVQIRERDPGDPRQDKDNAPADEAEDAREDKGDGGEDLALDMASVANTLHVLEGVAAEGRRWLQRPDLAGVWSGDDGANQAEAVA